MSLRPVRVSAKPPGARVFTLIELIVVVLILGILAAVAVVGYNTLVGNARDASAVTTVAELERHAAALAAASYISNTNYTEGGFAAADFEPGFVSYPPPTGTVFTVNPNSPCDLSDQDPDGDGVDNTFFDSSLCDAGLDESTIVFASDGQDPPHINVTYQGGQACWEPTYSLDSGKYSEGTCPLAGSVPNAPASPTIAVSNTQVVVSYTPPDDGGNPILTYQVRYTPSGTQDWVYVTPTDQLSSTVTNLTHGLTYDFQVAAVNVRGTGEFSPTVQATIPAVGVSTLAGGANFATLPVRANINATGTNARFDGPYGVTTTADNTSYITEVRTAGNSGGGVRKITNEGVVTTLAGFCTTGYLHTDGTGSAACFNTPKGSVVGPDGNLYVSDTTWIRKVTPAGVVTSLAGSNLTGFTNGTTTAARFSDLRGITLASDGALYVADSGNNAIRKVTLAGVVTTFVGSSAGSSDGSGTAATFNNPYDIAWDGSSNVFYIVDKNNHTIRKSTLSGDVTTIAGTAGSGGFQDGARDVARLYSPNAVTVTPQGTVYIADGSKSVRTVSPTGAVTTVAGQYTPGNPSVASNYVNDVGTNARFSSLTGVSSTTDGQIRIADYNTNSTIRNLSTNSTVTTFAGAPPSSGYLDGPGTVALFNNVRGVAVDTAGNTYVADLGNNAVRKITQAGAVSTFATVTSPRYVAVDANNNVYVTGNANVITKLSPAATPTTFTVPGVCCLTGVAVDAAQNVYTQTNSSQIRKTTLSGVSTILTTIPGANIPSITYDASSPSLVAANSATGAVLRVSLAGAVTTVATLPSASNAGQVTVDSSGNIYVIPTESSGVTLRKVTPSGVVTTVIPYRYGYTDGSLASASFSSSAGIATSPTGVLVIGESDTSRIRVVVLP